VRSSIPEEARPSRRCKQHLSGTQPAHQSVSTSVHAPCVGGDCVVLDVCMTRHRPRLLHFCA
jgi:hypothetical protein